MGLYTICQIIITFEWNAHTSQKLFMKEITFVFSEQIAEPKWLPEREVLLFFFSHPSLSQSKYSKQIVSWWTHNSYIFAQGVLGDTIMGS